MAAGAGGPYVLALDQGTTSSRAILFDRAQAPAAIGRQELPQRFPQPGWVEHDPEDLWAGTIAAAQEALARADVRGAEIAAIGIANQRETTLLWSRADGRPLHRAIVWQDRRTADACARLRGEGLEPWLAERTGLLADPYFSATKLAWLLDHVPGARALAEAGDLAFGTVDSWLIWRLTGGKVHATDATNAARTLLCRIDRAEWDEDLLRLFRIPAAVLPEIRASADDFGATRADLLGAAIPIRGVAGDQQAAALGQACVAPGMMKATYGTGCFALLNTGTARPVSRHRLLTTIAWRIGGETAYALEGAIFCAGAVVQWLRDGLGIIRAAEEAEALAAKADPASRVVLTPAFTGLGAPWWDADCLAAIHGLARSSGPAEIARAALESVAFQTRDLVDAMRADWPELGDAALRVDGGMAASGLAMQMVADMLAAPVERPASTETTALGAAWLAGMQAGLWPGRDGLAAAWRAERRFEPALPEPARAERHARWLDAVGRTLSPGAARARGLDQGRSVPDDRTPVPDRA